MDLNEEKYRQDSLNQLRFFAQDGEIYFDSRLRMISTSEGAGYFLDALFEGVARQSHNKQSFIVPREAIESVFGKDALGMLRVDVKMSDQKTPNFN